ncbi:hypothetical protein MSAN_01156000 [Mycena sanguinolenta]|uniref:Mug135-like C-terminal domain-containing protein n=1 Tax=Mycena sanguinolenta TaxID=230812 RepID=A0A8H7D3W2_9AGAR|nr:hypothetical protein MSAN_01156000 [Mycena sanguinolenta]
MLKHRTEIPYVANNSKLSNLLFDHNEWRRCVHCAIQTASFCSKNPLIAPTMSDAGGADEVPPAWFQHWNATQFQPLVAMVREMKSFGGIQKINAEYATGHNAPFGIIPFLSGDDPTQDPYNLPAIYNISVLTNLNPASLNEYLRGYGLTAQGSRDDKIRRLCATYRVLWTAVTFGPSLVPRMKHLKLVYR